MTYQELLDILDKITELLKQIDQDNNDLMLVASEQNAYLG